MPDRTLPRMFPCYVTDPCPASRHSDFLPRACQPRGIHARGCSDGTCLTVVSFVPPFTATICSLFAEEWRRVSPLNSGAGPVTARREPPGRLASFVALK